MSALYDLLAPALGFVLGWFLGVRHGFRRGFQARLAGAIPPGVARSRQLTKQFGLGMAKGARAAHKAELARLREHGQKPKWRQRLSELFFPCVLVAIALLTSCDAGRATRATCERSYNDTIVIRLDTLRDTVHVHLGGCK